MRHKQLPALLALVAALVAAACGGMSEAQVRKTAAEWFSESEKAAGEVVREVRTTDPLKADKGGVAGWAVQVSGTLDSTGAVKIVYLFVNGATGEVTKMGEGQE